MRNWSNNIDIYGMPTMTVQDNGVGEGGDSAQRFGMTLIGMFLNRKYKKRIQLDLLAYISSPSDGLYSLECPECPGDYRRHPHEDFWGSACDRMTRDQATGIVAAFCAGRMLETSGNPTYKFPNRRWRTFRFAFNMFKRFGMTNNSTKRNTPKTGDHVGKSWFDWFGLPQWSNLIRCYPILSYMLYPILCFLDLEIVINSIILKRRVSKIDKIQDGPDVSSITTRMACTKALPTPIVTGKHNIGYNI